MAEQEPSLSGVGRLVHERNAAASVRPAKPAQLAERRCELRADLAVDADHTNGRVGRQRADEQRSPPDVELVRRCNAPVLIDAARLMLTYGANVIIRSVVLVVRRIEI